MEQSGISEKHRQLSRENSNRLPWICIELLKAAGALKMFAQQTGENLRGTAVHSNQVSSIRDQLDRASRVTHRMFT